MILLNTMDAVISQDLRDEISMKNEKGQKINGILFIFFSFKTCTCHLKYALVYAVV